MKRLVLRLGIAVASLAAGAWGAGHVYIAAHRHWPEPSPADAVVVLGTSSTTGDGQPNPCMRVRVTEGVRLVEAGLAPVLIVTGGLDARDGLIEAETMADLAVEMGLDPDRLVVEGRSTSTIENLVFAQELLGIETPRLIVVTEPFHLPRAVMAADRLGIDVEPAPSTTCDARDAWWIIREPVALWWYAAKLSLVAGRWSLVAGQSRVRARDSTLCPRSARRQLLRGLLARWRRR